VIFHHLLGVGPTNFQEKKRELSPSSTYLLLVKHTCGNWRVVLESNLELTLAKKSAQLSTDGAGAVFAFLQIYSTAADKQPSKVLSRLTLLLILCG